MHGSPRRHLDSSKTSKKSEEIEIKLHDHFRTIAESFNTVNQPDLARS